MRPIRYRIIAEDLRQRITSGEFRLGAVLPSEADLSAAYEASRVTVRRALEALRSDGLVESRQGFGWLVSAEPLRQDLTRLATLDGQLGAAGVRSERRIVSFGFRRTPPRVREFLSGRTVLEVVRLHLADDRPFARVTVWCREDLGAALSRDDVERSAFLEQLPVRLGGATQTIGADAASSADAEVLLDTIRFGHGLITDSTTDPNDLGVFFTDTVGTSGTPLSSQWVELINPFADAFTVTVTTDPNNFLIYASASGDVALNDEAAHGPLFTDYHLNPGDRLRIDLRGITALEA